ncbi:MAG: 7-cyano-7-deazaguanine synthase [Candidatus Gottesmanbacteria bacterium]
MKFSKLSKKQIFDTLQTRELENVPLLKIIDTYLMQLRRYIIKSPPPGTPVISLMSGGLDTTVITEYLMRIKKLQVYPVYFYRHKKNSKRALASIRYFSKRFKKLYPSLYHEPITFDLYIPPKLIEKDLFKSQDDIIPPSIYHHKGVPFQPNIYAYYCAYYARFLSEREHVNVNTIIGSWLPSNSDWYSYETVTAFRLIMLNLISMTRDTSFQFYALPMEPELGYFFDKEELIRWGVSVGIPLARTWTCGRGGYFQCGQCTQCSVRKDRFEISGIQDKTIYKQAFIDKAKKLLKNVLQRT